MAAMPKTDGLKMAYDFELKGVNLYMKLAAGIDNRLAKEVLYSLAKQEVEHAHRIDTILASLSSNKGWATVKTAKLPSVETEIRKFFSEAARTTLRKGSENLEGYEMAMKMERKGYNAYKQLHEAAVAKEEKAFYKQMMTEENEHYDSLANVYLYLTDTADWLQVEESKTWSWLNL
jgi:rubrerythrin